MKIVALDLSLSGTGWAQAITGPQAVTWGTLVFPKPRDSMARLFEIRRLVIEMCNSAELVIFEGLSFGSNDPGAQERAGLAYLIRMALWEKNTPYVLVAPTTLKKFITGKGSAPKELIIKEVLKRWGHDVADNNQADSVGLAYVGMAITGNYPPANEPQRQVIAGLSTANPWLKRFAEAA